MCHVSGNLLVYPEVVTSDSSSLRAVDQPNWLAGRELRYRRALMANSRSSSSEVITIGRKTMVWLRTDHPDRYLIAR